ncbi:Trna-specific adenosine deaminase [Globisporangium polare]
MATLAEVVAGEVLRWFNASAECQKKIPPSQWTVLAGVVIVSQPVDVNGGSSSSTARILTAATGNKCLGQRDLHANGLVVNDCHAEILARRALLRYLYTEALTWAAGREDSEASLFEIHPSTQRLQLKKQHSLHLYISEAPCGDAAIYQLRDDVVDELVKQRVERAVAVSFSHEVEAGTCDQQTGDEERSAFRLTGAKAKRKRDEPFTPHNGSRDSVGDLQQQSQEKRFDQMTGIARVKSGRSDLPADKQTLSMSCSDKLAKWNALGVQGTLLLQFYEPLFLNSIVVSADDVGISMAAQQEALERAVSGRLEPRMGGDNGSAVELQSFCEFHIVGHRHGRGFQRRRTKERAAASLALNWTCREAHWRDPTNDNSNAVTKTPSHTMLSKFFQNADVEVQMAATGLKQGAKKVAKMGIRETQKVASRLAKWTLFLAFERVLSASKSSSSNGSDSSSRNNGDAQPVSLSYQQQKDAIPVKRPDVSSESSQATDESVQRVRERKRAFLTAIETWIGVPAAFKQFTIGSQ